MTMSHTGSKRIDPERAIESVHPGIADGVTRAGQVNAGSVANIARRMMAADLA